MAAMRSVSLTRQLPMLRSVHGPSANRASTAAVIAASGIWLKSRSKARARGRRPRDSIQFDRPMSTRAPMARPRARNRTSPCMLALPTPSTRTGPPPRAPAARKYDAEDASPSTSTSPGDAYPAPAGMSNACQPSRRTSTPKRSHEGQGDLDVGLGNELAFDLDARRLPGQRQRPSAPRTGTGSRRCRERGASPRRDPERGAIASGGNPGVPSYAMRAPAGSSASTRSPIGRSCMRGHARQHVVAVGERQDSP